MELVTDSFHVGADRFDRDLQFVRDLLVDVAGGEESEDLVLPRRELLVSERILRRIEACQWWGARCEGSVEGWGARSRLVKRKCRSPLFGD